MSKLSRGNNCHLTLSDRVFIEQELIQGSPFYSIAKALSKDPTTISKEVKRSRTFEPAYDWWKNCRLCWNYKECRKRNVCDVSKYISCHKACRYCSHKDVTKYCTEFQPYECNRINKAPYVCNACDHYRDCPLKKAYYSAMAAQEGYEDRLVNSRRGINLTPEELKELNDLISPLIKQGQPLSHIFSSHGDKIPVCRRTLYNYFDQKVFHARNIDLPRRVRYKKRRKNDSSSTRKHQDQTYRNKRTYKDFLAFTEKHPELGIVEMDTVKGGRTGGKCLLTLLFRNSSFMLIILLPQCTQEYVTKAINDLYEKLGPTLFKKYFPVILTDNGPEFKNPWDLENANGEQRTHVFYCDPYVSNQKARLEKNHEYIRYVIPKGRSMSRYTQEDINLMASHINSTCRDSLNGAAPFDLADVLLDKRIPLLTGQKKVSPDNVMLKPALLNK